MKFKGAVCENIDHLSGVPFYWKLILKSFIIIDSSVLGRLDT